MCSRSSKILFNIHCHGTGLFMTTTIRWQRISKEGVINNFLTGVYKQSVKHVLKLWPDLPKEVLYTQSFKTHFLLPFVSYIIGPKAHVFNTAGAWTVCHHSGRPLSQAFLMSTSAQVALKWSNLLLASRQLTVNHHTTSLWVWPWI